MNWSDGLAWKWWSGVGNAWSNAIGVYVTGTGTTNLTVDNTCLVPVGVPVSLTGWVCDERYPPRYFCAYCHGRTFDDSYGHCAACGAPRDE